MSQVFRSTRIKSLELADLTDASTTDDDSAVQIIINAMRTYHETRTKNRTDALLGLVSGVPITIAALVVSTKSTDVLTSLLDRVTHDYFPGEGKTKCSCSKRVVIGLFTTGLLGGIKYLVLSKSDKAFVDSRVAVINVFLKWMTSFGDLVFGHVSALVPRYLRTTALKTEGLSLSVRHGFARSLVTYVSSPMNDTLVPVSLTSHRTDPIVNVHLVPGACLGIGDTDIKDIHKIVFHAQLFFTAVVKVKDCFLFGPDTQPSIELIRTIAEIVEAVEQKKAVEEAEIEAACVKAAGTETIVIVDSDDDEDDDIVVLSKKGSVSKKGSIFKKSSVPKRRTVSFKPRLGGKKRTDIVDIKEAVLSLDPLTIESLITQYEESKKPLVSIIISVDMVAPHPFNGPISLGEFVIDNEGEIAVIKDGLVNLEHLTASFKTMTATGVAPVLCVDHDQDDDDEVDYINMYESLFINVKDCDTNDDLASFGENKGTFMYLLCDPVFEGFDAAFYTRTFGSSMRHRDVEAESHLRFEMTFMLKMLYVFGNTFCDDSTSSKKLVPVPVCECLSPCDAALVVMISVGATGAGIDTRSIALGLFVHTVTAAANLKLRDGSVLFDSPEKALHQLIGPAIGTSMLVALTIMIDTEGDSSESEFACKWLDLMTSTLVNVDRIDGDVRHDAVFGSDTTRIVNILAIANGICRSTSMFSRCKRVALDLVCYIQEMVLGSRGVVTREQVHTILHTSGPNPVFTSKTSRLNVIKQRTKTMAETTGLLTHVTTSNTVISMFPARVAHVGQRVLGDVEATNTLVFINTLDKKAALFSSSLKDLVRTITETTETEVPETTERFAFFKGMYIDGDLVKQVSTLDGNGFLDVHCCAGRQVTPFGNGTCLLVSDPVLPYLTGGQGVVCAGREGIRRLFSSRNLDVRISQVFKTSRRRGPDALLYPCGQYQTNQFLPVSFAPMVDLLTKKKKEKKKKETEDEADNENGQDDKELVGKVEPMRMDDDDDDDEDEELVSSDDSEAAMSILSLTKKRKKSPTTFSPLTTRGARKKQKIAMSLMTL
jgi:hypothetical protein